MNFCVKLYFNFFPLCPCDSVHNSCFIFTVNKFIKFFYNRMTQRQRRRQCYLLSKLPTSQSRKYCIAQCFCQSNSLLLLYQMYMDSVALYPNLPKYSALKSFFVSSRRNNRSVSVIIKSPLIILYLKLFNVNHLV